ncbi:uncharacterized protein MONOS_10409 [Monocercomonoides exilis]|uniref:uncharacterized protein n=1 Tax=Monocercomonoides exilis TaxID=2049356 RepID=UPI00355A35D6|nr:hypothetical protein MONOS_10409 [Monocercomonoides exilis]|eukprot:MONOS_10409.1-p1 / transcript=MONOS_10409.1 / gene=MONOS_10409 / organism=Monocercomonoides_exilis_PA203 / gene_product=unspecified product / transcript_product=unspecified product / location=Mono_scaffold00473:19323-20644(-) / protein_length=401 / sequence_SO=supercontig / SO=protein_coding / is_pseudo=false
MDVASFDKQQNKIKVLRDEEQRKIMLRHVSSVEKQRKIIEKARFLAKERHDLILKLNEGKPQTLGSSQTNTLLDSVKSSPASSLTASPQDKFSSADNSTFDAEESASQSKLIQRFSPFNSVQNIFEEDEASDPISYSCSNEHDISDHSFLSRGNRDKKIELNESIHFTVSASQSQLSDLSSTEASEISLDASSKEQMMNQRKKTSSSFAQPSRSVSVPEQILLTAEKSINDANYIRANSMRTISNKELTSTAQPQNSGQQLSPSKMSATMQSSSASATALTSSASSLSPSRSAVAPPSTASYPSSSIDTSTSSSLSQEPLIGPSSSYPDSMSDERSWESTNQLLLNHFGMSDKEQALSVYFSSLPSADQSVVYNLTKSPFSDSTLIMNQPVLSETVKLVF